MHELKRAKQLANMSAMLEDLAECPVLTAQMFHELSKRLASPRDFALRVVVASKDEGSDLLGHFSESVKIAGKPADLGALFRKYQTT